MRFLADMGISGLTVAWLRGEGHDAVHLRDEGLQRLSDPEITGKARAEDRVLLTMDLDFGYLMAVSGEQLPSVVLFRLSDERAEVVNGRLAAVFAQCGSDLAAGAINLCKRGRDPSAPSSDPTLTRRTVLHSDYDAIILCGGRAGKLPSP
jgi:predicted nuclease of predicted toxin-antitoxin system